MTTALSCLSLTVPRHQHQRRPSSLFLQLRAMQSSMLLLHTTVAPNGTAMGSIARRRGGQDIRSPRVYVSKRTPPRQLKCTFMSAATTSPAQPTLQAVLPQLPTRDGYKCGYMQYKEDEEAVAITVFPTTPQRRYLAPATMTQISTYQPRDPP